jgi:hypothetical protein
MRRFESEVYSRESFGYLTLCGILIDRDPNIAYEVVLEAYDTFGQLARSRPFVMPDGTPSGRPPTQADVTESWAYVNGWAPATGTVTFASRPIDSASDRDYSCPVPGEGAITHSTTRDGQVFSSPFGVYDPSYTRKVSALIPIHPGDRNVLCVTIYSDAGETPIATDTFVVEHPAVVELEVFPSRVVFQTNVPHGNAYFGVIPAGSFLFTIDSRREGCEHTFVNPELHGVHHPNDVGVYTYRYPEGGDVATCRVALDDFVGLTNLGGVGPAGFPSRDANFIYRVPVIIEHIYNGELLTYHHTLEFLVLRREVYGNSYADASPNNNLDLPEIGGLRQSLYVRGIGTIEGILPQGTITLVASSDR